MVWKELVARFIRDGWDELTFLERDDAYGNIFRKEIAIPENMMVRTRHKILTVDRCCNPRFESDAPFIFHSSYFRICKHKNAINVTTVHDFTLNYYPRGHRAYSFFHIRQRDRAIRKSDAIVCISENTKKDLFKFHPDINPEKVSVIYNGVSLDYCLSENIDGSLSQSLLWVGRRDPYKNWEWFLRVAGQSGRSVVFCGTPLSEKESELADTYLGKGKYKVYSYLSNAELNIIYNSVYCLVYPSSYEGFGIPVIEAQKAGCPVITLAASSIPEIVGDTTLMMEELSEYEFMHKMKLLEKKDVRERVIREGLQNAERFSWERTYGQYRDLYIKLMRK